MHGHRSIDVRAMAEAISGHGIDTRHWVGYGQVGTMGDDGQPDYADPQAVHVDPGGVICDVVLSPLRIPITARYAGIQGGGSCTLYAPIRPGDEVLVMFPDGVPTMPPVIVAVLNNKASPLPLADDNKPVFRNDRLSVYAKDVPIEIRTAAGSKVTCQVDGDVVVEPAPSKIVRLGGPSNLEKAALGESVQSFIDSLVTAYNKHTHISDVPTQPTSEPTAFISGAHVTSSNVYVKR